MMVKRMFLLFLLILALFSVAVVLADEPPVSPIVDVATANTDEGGLAALMLNADVLFVVAGAVLVIVIGGAFVLAHDGIVAARDNVSPDVFKTFGDSLISGIDGTLTRLIERSEQTANPYDDIAVNLAKIPMTALIDQLRERGYEVIGTDVGVAVKAESDTV